MRTDTLLTFPLTSRTPLPAAREKATCNNGTGSKRMCKGEGHDCTLSFINMKQNVHKRNSI